jgi:predicted lysophospholipase L1 biosynthesis ABC-type transport system permease subunit
MMVIVFTAGLGYIVYLLAFTDRSMGEMGVLRSLGLSKMQTAGLIGLEHMLVALIGLGVGTWAGFQMSRMVVSAVTVTDSGGRVVPPFILQTDWTIMGSIYGLLLLIFLGTLYILGRRMLHLDLQRLSRLGG